MISKGLVKASGILAVCLFVCAGASAQYGGGGGTGGSTGTGTMGSGTTSSSGYGSGNGKAIGIGVGAAAGAAVGIALLVHHHHASQNAQASITGCTRSGLNGMSLKNETDNVMYDILSKDTPVQAGERVELKGVVAKEDSDSQVLRVKSVVKDYGACGASETVASKSAVEANELAALAK
jgi:hypothetical protein